MRQVLKSVDIPVSLKGLIPPNSASDINPTLYKGDDVKTKLKKDHHLKCAYCECKLNGDFGHIEHFRPKGGYSIPPNNELLTPGYYWLAYDWSNLLLSCSKCNTSYKKNHFALEDETKRDIDNRNISEETPLLINPSLEDTSKFIEFHQHIIAPRLINGIESKKGRYTINLLKLNDRPELVDDRRLVWDRYSKWQDVMKVAKALIAQNIDRVRGNKLLYLAETEISKMKSPDAEYSAMFIDYNM